MQDHIMFCDYVKLRCEGYPKCKLDIFRKDYFDHTNTCLEVKIECENTCGQIIRKKFLVDQEHNCIEYMKQKLQRKRDKIEYLKNEQEYRGEVEALFKKEKKLYARLSQYHNFDFFGVI